MGVGAMFIGWQLVGSNWNVIQSAIEVLRPACDLDLAFPRPALASGVCLARRCPPEIGKTSSALPGK